MLTKNDVIQEAIQLCQNDIAWGQVNNSGRYLTKRVNKAEELTYLSTSNGFKNFFGCCKK